MKIENLSAGYDRKIILHDINITIKPGEIISLIGPNGGGKSTLLKTIEGELEPIGGTVFINKKDVSRISPKELSKELSIVNTQRVKPELMTAMEVVLSGRLPYSKGLGRFSDIDRRAAADACELMQLTAISDTFFENLSDGQKQRTLIARAICQEPDFLVMDEPTSYLDIRYRLELMDVIKRLSRKGVTVIMSLHELELALEISDRLLLVRNDGEVTVKTPRQVLDEGTIAGLYELSGGMYDRVKRQFEAAGQKEEIPKAGPKHSTFFLNKECEYYPCHELNEESFSCLFCYCPLYDMPDCGGDYTMTEKGAKNCRNCSFVHDRANYPKVIKRLKGKLYGCGTDRRL